MKVEAIGLEDIQESLEGSQHFVFANISQQLKKLSS